MARKPRVRKQKSGQSERQRGIAEIAQRVNLGPRAAARIRGRAMENWSGRKRARSNSITMREPHSRPWLQPRLSGFSQWSAPPPLAVHEIARCDWILKEEREPQEYRSTRRFGFLFFRGFGWWSSQVCGNLIRGFSAKFSRESDWDFVSLSMRAFVIFARLPGFRWCNAGLGFSLRRGGGLIEESPIMRARMPWWVRYFKEDL